LYEQIHLTLNEASLARENYSDFITARINLLFERYKKRFLRFSFKNLRNLFSKKIYMKGAKKDLSDFLLFNLFLIFSDFQSFI